MDPLIAFQKQNSPVFFPASKIFPTSQYDYTFAPGELYSGSWELHFSLSSLSVVTQTARAAPPNLCQQVPDPTFRINDACSANLCVYLGAN